MMNAKKTKVLMAGAALLAVLAGGCNSSSNSLYPSAALVEPDPAKALVYAEPGLGAADALGHALFVEEGYRFAQANAVFQMAAAEQPSLKLNGAVYGSPLQQAIPQQVIVSAEDLQRQLLAEGKLTPAATTTVTGVETQD